MYHVYLQALLQLCLSPDIDQYISLPYSALDLYSKSNATQADLCCKYDERVVQEAESLCIIASDSGVSCVPAGASRALPVPRH